MVFGMIGGMFLFWTALVVLAVLLIRSLFKSNGSPNNSTAERPLSAREILEHRYARGEINQEQYQSMLRDLLQ